MVELSGGPPLVPEFRVAWPHRPRQDVGRELWGCLRQLQADRAKGLVMEQTVDRTARALCWAIADLVTLDKTTWEQLVAELEIGDEADVVLERPSDDGGPGTRSRLERAS